MPRSDRQKIPEDTTINKFTTEDGTKVTVFGVLSEKEKKALKLNIERSEQRDRG